MSDIHVDAVDGDDLEDGTSWGNAVKTLARGVSLLSGEETLEARNGKNGHEFKERIELSTASKAGTEANHTKIITNDRSIIDAEHTRDECISILSVDMNYVDLEGWKLFNGKLYNVLLYQAQFVTVDDCIVQGSLAKGVYNNVGSNSIIKNSIISNNATYNIGLHTNGLIDNCSIHDGTYGILEYGANNEYKNNEIYNCSTRGYYMRLPGISKFHHNYVHNNAVGIYVRNDVNKASEVYFNDIYDNTLDAQDEEGINWDKDGKGNYWGYGGEAYDADKDAIGDDPKSIAGSAGSQDNYPLMCSYKIWDKCPYLAVPKKKWALGRVGVRFVRL